MTEWHVSAAHLVVVDIRFKVVGSDLMALGALKVMDAAVALVDMFI